MNPLTVLIVDDEPLARERLRALLEGEPSVEVAGECCDGIAAAAAIRERRPDVVFLDIDLPGRNGLQLLKDLPARARPAVVFVTAHEQFAVEAFAAEAVDYMLKPFDGERVQAALRRVRAHLNRPAGGDGAKPTPPALRSGERLTVKSDGRFVFLRFDEIVWIESADSHVVFHLSSGRLTVRETLTAIEERLGTERFARINRSAIVHLDQIKELQPTFHRDYIVVLRDGTRIPLSRSLRGRLGRLGAEI